MSRDLLPVLPGHLISELVDAFGAVSDPKTSAFVESYVLSRFAFQRVVQLETVVVEPLDVNARMIIRGQSGGVPR